MLVLRTVLRIEIVSFKYNTIGIRYYRHSKVYVYVLHFKNRLMKRVKSLLCKLDQWVRFNDLYIYASVFCCCCCILYTIVQVFFSFFGQSYVSLTFLSRAVSNVPLNILFYLKFFKILLIVCDVSKISRLRHGY